MALQQRNAPGRAQYPVPGPAHRTRPRSGLVHVSCRHRERFTVVGNHLAQHRELSLLAIGLAVHIQSVPDGARVDIKSLTARFPEGETRIAGALRELEAHGYLARTVRRTPNGRMVTRTVSYARPGTVRAPDEPRPAAAPPPAYPAPGPTAPAEPEQHAPQLHTPQQQQYASEDASRPAPRPADEPSPQPAAPPKPPLPAPRTPDPVRQATATALLASLRQDDDRLLLSERDVAGLAPAVDAWLERGTKAQAVRKALTAQLPPDPLRSPAAFLGHRLTAQLPPPLPAGRQAPRIRIRSRSAPTANARSAPRNQAPAARAERPATSAHHRLRRKAPTSVNGLIFGGLQTFPET